MPTLTDGGPQALAVVVLSLLVAGGVLAALGRESNILNLSERGTESFFRRNRDALIVATWTTLFSGFLSALVYVFVSDQ